MRITVIFSGLFRVLAGVEQEILDVEKGATVELLSRMLEKKYRHLPLERRKTYFIINNQVSAPNQVLAEGDRVQVFQLLAGG
jgi:molybdopterin converting factor small subunit